MTEQFLIRIRTGNILACNCIILATCLLCRVQCSRRFASLEPTYNNLGRIGGFFVLRALLDRLTLERVKIDLTLDAHILQHGRVLFRQDKQVGAIVLMDGLKAELGVKRRQWAKICL